MKILWILGEWKENDYSLIELGDLPVPQVYFLVWFYLWEPNLYLPKSSSLVNEYQNKKTVTYSKWLDNIILTLKNIKKLQLSIF